MGGGGRGATLQLYSAGTISTQLNSRNWRFFFFFSFFAATRKYNVLRIYEVILTHTVQWGFAFRVTE
jgi:hypothetical protein